MRQPITIRPAGWEAATDVVDTWTRPGHLYRGMTEEEYMAHMDKGYIQSTGRYSHASEGTNFSHDAAVAESYINFGRDDPRRTGKPTYLVEIPQGDMRKSRDGYYKTHKPIPTSDMARVWRFDAQDGAVVGLLVWRKQ